MIEPLPPPHSSILQTLRSTHIEVGTLLKGLRYSFILYVGVTKRFLGFCSESAYFNTEEWQF